MKSANKLSNEKSLNQNPQKHYRQSDYSVHYENNLTKIKIKKVYNIEDECKNDEKFMPKIIEHSESSENSDKLEPKVDSIRDGNDANTDNKRRRSGNLNSSNEENSPKVCQEKKRSRIEQRQKMFDVIFFKLTFLTESYGIVLFF